MRIIKHLLIGYKYISGFIYIYITLIHFNKELKLIDFYWQKIFFNISNCLWVCVSVTLNVSLKYFLFLIKLTTKNLCKMSHAMCNGLNTLRESKSVLCRLVKGYLFSGFFVILWSRITTKIKPSYWHWKIQSQCLVTHLFTLQANTHYIKREIPIIVASHPLVYRLIISVVDRDNYHANRFWSLTQINHQHFTHHYFPSQYFLEAHLIPIMLFLIGLRRDVHWVGLEGVSGFWLAEYFEGGTHKTTNQKWGKKEGSGIKKNPSEEGIAFNCK